MYILPPEEKKPVSPLTKWILGILIAVCVVLGLALAGVSMLSGTSESHRRGLEQAISNAFRTKIEITTLNTFNVFPQFLIDANDIQGSGADGSILFKVASLRTAFSFMDVLGKKGYLENIDLSGLKFEAGVAGPQELVFSSIKLVPASAAAKPKIDIRGTYGQTPFEAYIEVAPIAGRLRPAYHIVRGSPFRAKIDRFEMDGTIGLNHDDFQELNDVTLRLDGKPVLTGSILVQPVDGKFAMRTSFKLGGSEGLFIYVPSSTHQSLSFKTLDLNDLLHNPLWPELWAAWHEDILRKVSVTPAENPSWSRVSVSVDVLKGDLSGEKLKGELAYTPQQLLGWWQGSLTATGAKNSRIPASGRVACALLAMDHKNNRWVSSHVSTVLEESVVISSLSVDHASGKIDYKTNSVTGKSEPVSADLAAFSARYGDLNMKDNPDCAALYKIAPPPEVPEAAPAAQPQPPAQP